MVDLFNKRRFAIKHSSVVFIIIPMICQVDRARRKEVAVKVREGKNYMFRDEVRSLGIVEFTRIF